MLPRCVMPPRAALWLAEFRFTRHLAYVIFIRDKHAKPDETAKPTQITSDVNDSTLMLILFHL